MGDILIRITVSYGCFGVVFRNGIVVDAAPIAKWMLGKSVETVIHWVSKTGGYAEQVTSNEETVT